MIDLTQPLVDAGNAYVVDTGSVYFDVTSFEGYGKLSGTPSTSSAKGTATSRPTRASAIRRTSPYGRRRDRGALMRWPSPWGEGFPGWHVECSAMSMKYLGERFDIHTGGTDLRFPHHEDEIAQSEGAVGHPVVSIWVHGGHLRQSGLKISKSTGNIVRPPTSSSAASTPWRSGGSPSRPSTAARWTSRGTRWRPPTNA